jgi:GNAT superfamily N-acetyltransferase
VSDGVVHRSYRPGDEAAILRLMDECGYRHDAASWRWINRDGPHGASLVELATADDRVVGHYAVLPRLIRVDDRPVRAGLAIQAVVHPAHRGLSVLSQLFARIVARCAEAGLPFIYGFPNDQVWLVYAKVFRWQALGDLVALELPLRGREPMPTSGPAVRVRDGFDERYATWDEGETPHGLTHVMKDAAYFDWRYTRHPRVRYRVLESVDDVGHPLAFAVLKRYEKAGVRYGHVVDLGAQPRCEAAVAAVLRAALADFRTGEPVDVVSTWMATGAPFFGALAELGFQPTGFTTHLAYRLIDPGFTLKPLDLERWHVAMGDSDAF